MSFVRFLYLGKDNYCAVFCLYLIKLIKKPRKIFQPYYVHVIKKL